MIAEVVARWLTDRGLIDYRPDADGGDTFIGFMPDKPDEAVSITGVPGPEPDMRLGWDTKAVQVRVRGGRDPVPAHAKAEAIFGELHGLHDVDMLGTWVVGCRSLQSEPASLGLDVTGQRMEYSINFEIEVRALTPHRE